ncbi:MAG: imidazole glycerol phosphate synthase subunit HisH [Saprospiraceae bacterium]|nr:imidazole glycerol phosphate synthase subunit HisH [Saprospiraceae bacterium]
MKVAVIDYNAGNTRSVYYALQRLGVDAIFTEKIPEIELADKVIFPGVGEASSTMQYLKDSGLSKVIPSLTQPVLGICLGMQLMCKWSEENDTDCLGIFDLNVQKFLPEQGEKVPHMGWNKCYDVKGELFRGSIEGNYTYFVHSYYVPVCQFTSARCDYIHPFSAAMQRDNFFATQFHPEKSGLVGAEILQNFLKI